MPNHIMNTKEDFQYTRKTKKISRTLNIILAVSFVLGLNILASKFYFRKDLTENRIYSLSPETLAYIEKLKKPLEIFVTLPSPSSQPESADAYLMISRLLNQYQHVARNNKNSKITIEYVDPFKQLQRAHQIAAQFGVQKENTIIFKSGNNYRQIVPAELYSLNHNGLEEFKGEQVFTSAILNVTGSQKEKIYFLNGHGEMRINDVDPLRGLSELNQLLNTYNIETTQIELNQLPEIPSDANLVIIAAPQTPFLPDEVAQLRRYLSDRNGRLIAFLDPIKQHGLDDLLYEWGILADDMLILDTGMDFKANGGDLILRSFTNHSITQFLEDHQLAVLTGLSRPVRPDIASPLDPRRTVTPLIWTSKTSWGERSHQTFLTMQFDPNKDLKGPLPVATLAERSVNSQLGINVPGSKFIVFGNSNFIANNRINSLGNRVLFQNTINWAIDLNDLLNIPQKTLKSFQITLSQKDLIRFALGMLTIPSSIACIGLLIFAIRRR